MFNSFSFNVSLYFLVLRFEEHCIHLKLYIETNESVKTVHRVCSIC